MRSMPAGKYRWLFSQVKYFNKIEEQDHRSVNRVSSPMLGFKAFQSGKNVLAEIELMHMIRKGWLMTEGSDEMSIADQFYALPGQIRPLLGTAGRDHPKSALPSLMLQNLFLKGSHCLQCSLSENPCMTASRLLSLTTLAMLAFAGNSVLCRLALKQTSIDPASFTTIRLVSGALVLLVLASVRGRAKTGACCDRYGNRSVDGYWRSTLVLFLYASTFSFAYVSLPTGTGALLLFGAVQLTMIAAGWFFGERLTLRQVGGLALALSGLVVMLLPGLSAPPLVGTLLMLLAGVAWGAYCLLGRRVADPMAATAGNFLRAALFSLALSLALTAHVRLDASGVLYAVLSGALTSGIGYVVWYAALRELTATRAASVQLAVPVLAAVGGTIFLNEPITLRLMISCVAILGGIALVVLGPQPATNSANT